MDAGAPQPMLHTERLVLRPFTPEDAPEVQRLAGVREVADTTLLVPHPYPDGAATAWIATHAAGWAARRSITYAITERAAGALVGAIGLEVAAAHARGELGYWVALPCWGRGYATEAARELLAFGFDALGLNRIQAQYMTRNPASGRVLEKLGMRREGVHRQHVRRWDRFEDVAVCALLRADRPRG